MENYIAILFHPEGDFVTDFRSETKQDVWEKISDMGSKWIFYHIPFIGTDKTIVDTPEGLEFLNGKSIKTVQNFFKKEWKTRKEEICEGINKGFPLQFIY